MSEMEDTDKYKKKKIVNLNEGTFRFIKLIDNELKVR